MDPPRRLALLEQGQLATDRGDVDAGGAILFQPPFQGLPIQRRRRGGGAWTSGAEQAPQGIAPGHQDPQEGQAIEPENPGRPALQALPDREDGVGQGQQHPEDQQRQQRDPQTNGDANESGGAQGLTLGRVGDQSDG